MKCLLFSLVLIALAPAPLPKRGDAPKAQRVSKDVEDLARLIKEAEQKIEFEMKTNPRWETTVPYLKLELERLRKFYARRSK